MKKKFILNKCDKTNRICFSARMKIKKKIRKKLVHKKMISFSF